MSWLNSFADNKSIIFYPYIEKIKRKVAGTGCGNEGRKAKYFYFNVVFLSKMASTP